MNPYQAFAVVLLAIPAAAPAASAATRSMVCELRGGQMVPPVASSALGAGTFEIDTSANELRFSIACTGLDGAELGAQIRGPADPGVGGAETLFTLPAGSPKNGVWSYPETAEADILAGRTYVAVQSEGAPGGEVRGQIVSAVVSLDTFQMGTDCPTAGGWGVFMIDTCANTLSYHVVIEGTLCGNETKTHLHGLSLHGANPAILHVMPPGSPKVGVYEYAQPLEGGILDGRLSVILHTDTNPTGELRGQVTPIVVPMDPEQAVPPAASDAAGVGLAALDRGNDRMSIHLRYAGLAGAETAAHIHGFAPPGETAGVQLTMQPGEPKLEFWDYASGDESAVLDGQSYVNIHTTAAADGELRGQIVFPDPIAPCPWDLDNDCTVGITDLLALLAAWGAPYDITDLLALLASWGPC